MTRRSELLDPSAKAVPRKSCTAGPESEQHLSDAELRMAFAIFSGAAVEMVQEAENRCSKVACHAGEQDLTPEFPMKNLPQLDLVR